MQHAYGALSAGIASALAWRRIVAASASISSSIMAAPIYRHVCISMSRAHNIMAAMAAAMAVA